MINIHKEVRSIVKKRLPEPPEPGLKDTQNYFGRYPLEYEKAWDEVVAKLPINQRIEAKLDKLLMRSR